MTLVPNSLHGPDPGTNPPRPEESEEGHKTHSERKSDLCVHRTSTERLWTRNLPKTPRPTDGGRVPLSLGDGKDLVGVFDPFDGMTYTESPGRDVHRLVGGTPRTLPKEDRKYRECYGTSYGPSLTGTSYKDLSMSEGRAHSGSTPSRSDTDYDVVSEDCRLVLSTHLGVRR